MRRMLLALLALLCCHSLLSAGDPRWEEGVRRNFRNGKQVLAKGRAALAFRYWQAAFNNEPEWLSSSQAILMYEVAFRSHLLALHLNDVEQAEHYRSLMDRYLATAVEAGFVPDGRFMLRGIEIHREMIEALMKCPRSRKLAL